MKVAVKLSHRFCMRLMRNYIIHFGKLSEQLHHLLSPAVVFCSADGHRLWGGVVDCH